MYKKEGEEAHQRLDSREAAQSGRCSRRTWVVPSAEPNSKPVSGQYCMVWKVVESYLLERSSVEWRVRFLKAEKIENVPVVLGF